MFLLQLSISAVLICLTVIIHAVILNALMDLLEKSGPLAYKHFRRNWKTPLLVLTVLGTFFAHILQIWLWAGFYLLFTDLNGLEEALYFSTSTFTTVGFGDLVLDEEWRLTSSFQSANGFILFGWSTAFIFEVMSKLYRQDTIDRREHR